MFLNCPYPTTIILMSLGTRSGASSYWFLTLTAHFFYLLFTYNQIWVNMLIICVCVCVCVCRIPANVETLKQISTSLLSHAHLMYGLASRTWWRCCVYLLIVVWSPSDVSSEVMMTTHGHRQTDTDTQSRRHTRRASTSSSLQLVSVWQWVRWHQSV